MRVALLLGFAALAVALGAQLMHETTRLAGSNRVEPRAFVVESTGRRTVCQHQEILYADTARVRMTIGTHGRTGPPLRVRWSKDGRRLATARLEGGWREGVVTIELADPPSETVDGVSVCFRPEERRRLAWAGEERSVHSAATIAGRRQGGRISLVSEYAEPRSLLGLFGEAAARYPAGNAGWLGSWTWWAIIAVMAGALVAAAAALLARPEPMPRRVPRAGRLCALAAFLACTGWALLTPPFHVPDEIAHVSYAQAIVESGELPLAGGSPAYSEQQRNLLGGLRFGEVIGRSDARPPWSEVEERRVRAAETAPASRDVTDASTASANPPLYYLLQAPVYWATPSASLLDKLLPMRLLSALLGALTVLAVFLFLRELVPGRPWLWSPGALACAFHPIFGFISGGVNADALLFACAAWMFVMAARIVRRGLTMRRAVLIAAIVAAGALTKPLFLGVVPAAALAVLIGAFRLRRETSSVRRPLAIAAVAAAIVVVPVAAYNAIGSAAFDHPYFPGAVPGSEEALGQRSTREQLTHIWQLWLPRLPMQHDRFPDTFPLRDTWLSGFGGQFGWLDYAFPVWFYEDIVEPLGLLLLIALVAGLVLARRRVRARAAEFAVYLVGAGALAFAIGTQDYGAAQKDAVRFDQARYLLPLLALYGGVLAVALRPAGRRVGPLLGVAVVALAVLHALSAMVLTIGRYYA